MAQERAERDFEVKLLDEIADKSNIEVPDSMVEHELHHMIEDFEHRLSHQGLNLATYLEYIGKTIICGTETLTIKQINQILKVKEIYEDIQKKLFCWQENATYC